MSDLVLGVDIGGTKLAAGVVGADGNVVRRCVAPTGDVDGMQTEAIWRRLLDVVDEALDRDEVSGVGIGCGGPMDWPAGDVSPLNIPAWRGFPLRSRLARRFSDVPVRIHNDAIAMALGEHRFGAGRGSEAFLGMVVSTGVGGGLILSGRPVDGATGNAGHVGHVVVDPAGPPCACGGRGCLEAIARGPAVVSWALAHGWQPPSDAPQDGRSLAESARSGDAVAIAGFSQAGTAIGIAVSSVVHVLELDCVAVGGGLAAAGDLLLQPIRESFRHHAKMAFAASCRIVPAAGGADAGIIGAAALVHDAADSS